MMTGDELRVYRERLGLSQPAMGERLAQMMGRERPYTRQEIWRMEKGEMSDAVPAAVAAIIWRERALEAEKALALAMSRLERIERGRG